MPSLVNIMKTALSDVKGGVAVGGIGVGRVTAKTADEKYTVVVVGKSLTATSAVGSITVGARVLLARTDVGYFIVGDSGFKNQSRVEVRISG